MRPFPRGRTFLLAFITVLALCRPVAAQSIDPAAIDAIVKNAMRAWQVPGVAVALVRGDEVVYLKGFGVREQGGTQPVTADTLFAIASTSKAFTTTAIAMLVGDGKMSWDDPVSKYVEFFRLNDPLADKNVTLRDLVTHRTGLSRHDLLWYGSPWSREEIMHKIAHVKPTQPFRSAYQYQNIMFLTAGYAVGKASNSTWEDVVSKRIFEPLGMAGANFSTRDVVRADDHSSPHLRKNGKVEVIPWLNIDNVGPAGSINAGVRDLSKWLRFQVGDGTFEGKRLIAANRLKEAHSPQMVIPMDGSSGVPTFTRAANPETNMMSYGLGWVIQDYRGQLLVSHGGSINGFRSQVALLPKQNVGLVVLSNLGMNSLPEAVRNSIVDLALDAPKKDWTALFLAQNRKGEATQKARDKQREAKRRQGTKPSLELKEYTGAYEEPAYGKASIVLENGQLLVQWSSYKLKLDHFHYDTFTAKGEGILENRPLVFILGADGTVERMTFLDQEFKRVRRN
jgi:CubicO group peptidase (beta-lactamase class C family)